ncbi:MAG: hypothetical protein Q7S09_04980 [bacterium]|nr:hypothetical protein [bacterium]
MNHESRITNLIRNTPASPRRRGEAGQYAIRNSQRGISVIEVMIVIFVATVLLFSIAEVAGLSHRISSEKKLELRAGYYAHEGVEALHAMRDESWSTRIGTLSASTTYYIVPTASAWILSSSDPGALDGFFTRTAVMQNVYRDTNDDIASSGTLDPDTKKFTITLTWGTQTGTKTLAIEAYLTNLYKN